MPRHSLSPAYGARPTTSRAIAGARHILTERWHAGQRFREREEVARRYLWLDPPSVRDQGGFVGHWVSKAFLFDIPRDASFVVLPLLIALTVALYASAATFAATYPPCVDAVKKDNPGAIYGEKYDSRGLFNGSASVPWLIMRDISRPECLEVLVLAPWGGLISGPATEFSRGPRLLTSALMHFSVSHLRDNLLPLALLLWFIEPRYGAILTTLALMSGVLAGDFLLLAFSKAGFVIAGASSMAYALVGVLSFDAAVNNCWNHAAYFNIASAALSVLVLLITSIFPVGGTAVLGHVGGYLGGLGFALAAFPRFTDYRPTRARGSTGGEGDLEMVGDAVDDPTMWDRRVLPIAARPRAALWRYGVSRSIGLLMLVVLLGLAPYSAYTRSY